MPETTSASKVDQRVPDSAADFLLLEYESLYQLHQQAVAVGDSRLNFYIGFTAIMGSAVVGVQQFLLPAAYVWLLAFAVLMTLSLGLTTFRKILQRRTATIVYRRRLSRIRAWFVACSPSIAAALPYDLSQDQRLDWGKHRLGSTASSVAFINTGLVVLVVTGVAMSTFGIESFWWAIPAGAAAGVVTWWLHLVWKRRWFRAVEARDGRQAQRLEAMARLANSVLRYDVTIIAVI